MEHSDKHYWSNFAYDELNLCEIPMVRCKGNRESADRIMFSDSVRDSSTGKYVCRSFVLHPHEKNNRASSWEPTWKDVDILLALIKIKYDEDKFKSSSFDATLVELWETLGGSETKNRYRQVLRIKESLRRWSNLRINCNNWRHVSAWKEVSFSPIQIHSESDRPRSLCEQSLPLTFASEICDSLRGTYKRSFDWDLYLSISTPLARRLFRFLEKRFWQRTILHFPIEELSREKIGLSRNYSARKYKWQLQPAIAELARLRIIESDPPDCVFGKVAGEPMLRVRAGQASRAFERRGRRTKRKPKLPYVRSPRRVVQNRAIGSSSARSMSSKQAQSLIDLALREGPLHLAEGYQRTLCEGGFANEQYRNLLLNWAFQAEKTK